MTRPGALLLTPGAGSDRNNACLVAIDVASGLPCERIDFPYRKAGRRAPDRALVLLQCVVDEAALLCRRAAIDSSALVLGGRSMGGRMCSMAVAAGLPAAGLALVSYPLHPPGRPDRLRTEHLESLGVPCLFVHGTRDPFGSPDELTAATATIPGEVTHVWIEGGRHDLKGSDQLVADAVAGWLTGIR